MRYRKILVSCGCRAAGECNHNDFAWKIALDACVDGFAEALRRRLYQKFLEGKSGWDNRAWPKEDILRQLREHVDKGDMIDVANFAMFAWNRS